jgi:hypothetical protein
MATTLRAPLVIGNASELTRRVVVVGVGAPDIDPILTPRTTLYVNGDGVQALLDRGVLSLA